MEVTNEQVIDRLITSDHGKKIASDLMREQEMRRIDLAANIEKLKRERGELARQQADDTEATRQRLEQARAALTKADNEHRQAVMKQKQQRALYAGRIAKMERELLATAPAVINQFIEWLGDLEGDCKGTAIVTNARKTDRISTHSSEVIKQYFSNAKSLDARLKAIRTARAEAENLKPLILDADDLQQRLDALRELPAVSMQLAYEK